MAYANLAQGRTEQQLIELDMLLAPTPEAKEELIDQANARAMKQLGGFGGLPAGMKPKPKPRRETVDA